MTKVTELVADVVTPLAEARGDELVDVEYVKERSNIIFAFMLIVAQAESILKRSQI